MTRKELYYAKISGEDVTVPFPITREEAYLAKLAGEDVSIPDPITVDEWFLAALCGENVTPPAPVTRLQHLMAKALGLDAADITPVTIDEWFWYNYEAFEFETVTGVSPLALASAAAHAVKSLIQTGKCVTSGGDIYCNNGKLVALDDELPSGYKRIAGIKFDGDFYYDTGESLTGDDDVTMTLANTSTTGQNVFGSYNGTASGAKNFSLFIYGGGSTSNSYFRYGEQLLRPRFGSNERTITFGKSGTDGFATDVTATPESFTTPANAYIGMLPNSTSPAFTGSIIGNIPIGTRLKYIPVERESDGVIGYYERVKGNFIAPTGSGTPVSLGYDHSHETVLSVVGTPEVITLGEQTATAVDLFATDDAADEQDIISGVVTRRVEVTVTGGVITITPLATPVIEHVTPQPLSTVEGDNTLSWTAEVSGTVKEVEYAYVAPSFEWETASGAVVSVSDAIAGEVGALTVGINPVQTGSGDPSPSNVRPISGWTGLSVFRGGDNAFDADAYSTINGYIDANGKIVSSSGGAKMIWFPISPNTDYTIGIKAIAHITGTPAGSDDVQVGLFSTIPALNVVGTRIYAYNRPDVYTDYYHTVEFNSGGASYIAIKIGVQSKTDINASIATLVVAETSTIASEIVNWQSEAGTVYGGTLDVLTGVLTVDKVKFNFTGTESWGYLSSADGFFYCSLLTAGTFVSGDYITENGVKMYLNANNGQARVYLSNNTFLTSSSDMHDYCKSGIGFVYSLATPQTVQLTPAQVSTLLGTNVIWASGNGEVSVTYRAEVGE